MDRGNREATVEPVVKQYGFNINATAATATPARAVPAREANPYHLPIKESGRNSSLDGGGIFGTNPWAKKSKKTPPVQLDKPSWRVRPLQNDPDAGPSQPVQKYITEPWSGVAALESSHWGRKQGAQDHAFGIANASWADDPVSPLKAQDRDDHPFHDTRSSNDNSSSKASGRFSLGDRKSTGDSNNWQLGSSWQKEDAMDTPQSAFRVANQFRGFKDDCEAGSFTLGNTSQAVQSNGRIEVMGTLHHSERVRALVKSVIGGLRAWQVPEASDEGLGGTYFFMNELGQKQAIVKPCDEEPLAPNNPKGFVGRDLGEPGLKPTVRVGEAAMREVAAFLLDHQSFANVPATVLVRVTHNIFHVAAKADTASRSSERSGSDRSSTELAGSALMSNLLATTVKPVSSLAAPAVKLASMQEFVTHECDSSEFGSSRYSNGDVHKIGILDLRLFNTDRHSGNMLVDVIEGSKASHAWRDEQCELIPIDHGFCLPEALEPPYFEWMHWPQAKIPFDAHELDYIESLDPDADVAFLKRELPWIPDGSLRILQVATILLKKCAAAGLNLFQIASVASRPIVGMDEEPSELEKACLFARQRADMGMDTIPESDSEDADTAEMHDLLDDLPATPAGRSPAGKKVVVMGHETIINTHLSGDDMMFSLDEVEREYLSIEAKDSEKDGPSGLNFAQALHRDPSFDGEEADLPPWGAPPTGQSATFAKSLLAGLHPKVHSSVRHQRIRSGLAGHRQRNKLGQRKAACMPPFFVGNIEEMRKIFEGLDGTLWTAFLVALHDYIEDALEDGRWVQSGDELANQNVKMGVSCPRF